MEAAAQSTRQRLLSANSSRGGDTNVLFLIGRGGGGHKAAAIALRDTLLQRSASWADRIVLVDAGEIAETAIHGRMAGLVPSGDDVYNGLMKRGMYSLAGVSGHVARSSVRSNRKCIQAGFAKLWHEQHPVLVLSFVPFLNEAMRDSLAEECPGVKLVTVVTDMANSAAHLWIPPREEVTNHFIVAGNDVLESQARELGYDNWILRTSGMVVNPIYYSNAADEQMHAISSRTCKVVVFFGGVAPARTNRIVRNAVRSFPNVAFVVICGHNERLKRKLLDLPQDRCLVEGFIPSVRLRQHFSGAACVIGKPGPGAVAEAAVCKVPFVAEKRVMPQEECVLQYIQSLNIGFLVDSFENLPHDFVARASACKEALLRGEHMNRAVFELCDFVCGLVPAVPEHVAAVERSEALFDSEYSNMTVTEFLNI